MTYFYALPFFHFLLLLICYHAEFCENILIDVLLLLQKMYSFSYFENLNAKEEPFVWDAEEPIV